MFRYLMMIMLFVVVNGCGPQDGVPQRGSGKASIKRIQWFYPVGNPRGGAIAVDRNLVVFGEEEHLNALDRQTGELVWRHSFEHTDDFCIGCRYLKISGNRVYVGGIRNDYVFQSSTGKLIKFTPHEWSADETSNFFTITSKDGKYILDEYMFDYRSGEMFRYNAADGSRQGFWQNTELAGTSLVGLHNRIFYFFRQDFFRDQFIGYPGLAGNTSDYGGFLRAVDENSGKELWRLTLQSELGQVAFANHQVFITTLRSGVYAVNAEDMIWFDWEQNDAAENQIKYGIPFEEGVSVFSDPNALVEPDPDHPPEMARFMIISDGRVVHYARESDSAVRIFSVRQANDQERQRYWKDHRTRQNPVLISKPRH